MATAEFSKFASILSATLSQHHLSGFEALRDLAKGQATKIVVPSDVANVTGLLASLKETVVDDKPKAEAKPDAKKSAK